MQKQNKISKGVITKIVMIVLFSALVLYTLIIIGTLCWGLLTSLKNYREFENMGNVMGLPNLNADEPVNSTAEFFQLANYQIIWSNFNYKWTEPFYSGTMKIVHYCDADFVTMLVNTLLYTVGGAVIYAFMPALTAYLCAKYPYKLSKALFVIYLMMMSMPIVGNYPTELTFLRDTQLYDNILGNYIQKMTGSGMYFFVYYAYFQGVSNTYREAAEIDGASQTTIMFGIYFPLAIKMISTVFLIQFVNLWNDYQTPLMYLPTHPTLAFGVYYVSYQALNPTFYHTPIRIAGCMMLAIPIIIIFVIFKDRLMGDVSLGGIKE